MWLCAVSANYSGNYLHIPSMCNEHRKKNILSSIVIVHPISVTKDHSLEHTYVTCIAYLSKSLFSVEIHIDLLLISVESLISDFCSAHWYVSVFFSDILILFIFLFIDNFICPIFRLTNLYKISSEKTRHDLLEKGMSNIENVFFIFFCKLNDVFPDFLSLQKINATMNRWLNEKKLIQAFIQLKLLKIMNFNLPAYSLTHTTVIMFQQQWLMRFWPITTANVFF